MQLEIHVNFELQFNYDNLRKHSIDIVFSIIFLSFLMNSSFLLKKIMKILFYSLLWKSFNFTPIFKRILSDYFNRDKHFQKAPLPIEYK